VNFISKIKIKIKIKIVYLLEYSQADVDNNDVQCILPAAGHANAKSYLSTV
jgi:hypothetical protein